MTYESVFKYPALIGCLVKKIKDKYEGKQIGKTIIQKMIYLLGREGVGDFNYSMYHYGPYSSGVSKELYFAERAGIVDIQWIMNGGYDIGITDKLKTYLDEVTTEEETIINTVVEKYGSYSAVELSIIATALFLKDNYAVSPEELPRMVNNIKPQYDTPYIEKILKKGDIELKSIH